MPSHYGVLPLTACLADSYEKVATEAVRLVIGGTAFLSLFTTIPWASGCALQNYLPASILPTRRFFAQGFLAGLPVMALPAFAVPELTFSLARMSVLSWWGVSVKQKRVKTRRCACLAMRAATRG